MVRLSLKSDLLFTSLVIFFALHLGGPSDSPADTHRCLSPCVQLEVTEEVEEAARSSLKGDSNFCRETCFI